MLALKINFITGRYAASAYNDRQAAEWPPHPARVFSALVAAWAEASDQPCPHERRVLEWLESAGPPSIMASPASNRRVMTHFVPVNDAHIRQSLQNYRDTIAVALHDCDAAQNALEAAIASNDSKNRKLCERALKKAQAARGKAEAKLVQEAAKRVAPADSVNASAIKSAMSMLPEGRVRQGRHFPSVSPMSPEVHLIWDHDMPQTEKTILTCLARRVVRIGHSSSLVHISVEESAPEANWSPDDDGETVLRVVGGGQLDALETEWRQHRETEPRVLPCRFQRYRLHGIPPASMPESSCFSEDWIVFRRVGGPKLPITRCADVACAFRRALLHYAEDPPDEVLSGHTPDGRPTDKPHAAFVPLPFVGHPHADGRLMGIAVVLPRNLMELQKRAVFRAIGLWEAACRIDEEETPVLELQLGRAGILELERNDRQHATQVMLRASTWCRPSRRWLSTTPVALDRNPGDLYSGDHQRSMDAYKAAADTIATACTRIGLPSPAEVVVLPSATMPGTVKARHFPAFPSKPGSVQRAKVHALIRFTEPVSGPLLIGAGRFFGLGLFRPLAQEEVLR